MIRSPMMDGDPATAKLLVVAMSPGEEELEKGLPLVGPTGHMLWTWLGKMGISRADCLCVNTIGELPEGNHGKTISDEQFDKYWDQFNSAVASFQGRVALVLGGDALWRFTGLSGGIESWRGYLVEPTDVPPNIERTTIVMGVYKTGPKKGTPKKEKKRKAEVLALPPNLKVIVPTLHPSGIMRTGNTTLPAFVADLRHVAYLQAASDEAVDNLMRSLNNEVSRYNVGFEPTSIIDSSTNVVFDIEGYNHITHIALATDGSEVYSYDWGTEARAKANELLSNPRLTKIAHNAPFDMEKLTADDVEIVGPIADTMLMAAMVEPDLPKGLKYISPMYNMCKRWDHLADSNIKKYNAMDVRMTQKNFYILRDILGERHQWNLFMETIMPCVPTLMKMSRIGLFVDVGRQTKWVDKLSKELFEAQLKWVEKYPTAPEPSKNKALKTWFKSLGLPVKFNKYGAETLDENAIRTLMVESPTHAEMLEQLLRVRGLAKDLSTYADIDLSPDSTVHPSYLPAGKDDDRYDEDGHKAGKGLAGTFRPTAKGPNIQNQTKEARLIYVPRIRGYSFGELDFNSFEAKILAALSKDAALQEALDSTDFHELNRVKLGVDRTRAKNGFYCWSYGGGARTLFNTFRGKGYNVSYNECKNLLEGFDRLYPKAKMYREMVIANAKASRCVTNPFGFKRWFYAKDVGTAPANTMIQSTAAIIMWKILPQLEAEAKRQQSMMVAMVHDSVEFELAPTANVQALKAIMEQEFPEIAPGFRCPVNIKIGPSWGEVKEVG